uniref:Uncharacterized protein n=1 Tax=Triticum urartu TaxID=4572 RepID=A0A8R7U1E4_TRIUA
MPRRDGVEDGIITLKGFGPIIIEFFGYAANRCATSRQPAAPSLSPTLDNVMANGLRTGRPSVPVLPGWCGPSQLLAQGGVRTACFVTLIF